LFCRQLETSVDPAGLGEDISRGDSLQLAFAEPMPGCITKNCSVAPASRVALSLKSNVTPVESTAR